MKLTQKEYFRPILRISGIALLSIGFALPFVLAQDEPSFTGTW